MFKHETYKWSTGGSWKCKEKLFLFQICYFPICLECINRNALSLGHLDWDPNSVLKRLLSLMNWCFVCFQVSFSWSREIARGSHWKGFFPSWTNALCVFKVPFLAKLASQLLHWKGFFPSWTDSMCSFKWALRAKLASQVLHWKGFSPSWTEAWCLFKELFLVKLASQVLHWKGFFPSWTDSMCLFKQAFRAKLESQIPHWKGFFPSWTDSMCPFKL